ncbi:MAG: hypothetical protein F9K46_19150 [Anaerolineae bacterium]|nr:MAG: hypothetical protein F9K46_19150 [Anaerolineae bacterium]
MAENDFQRASMRGLGKKILLGDESAEPTDSVAPVEPTAVSELAADNPAVLKLTTDEELDLLATVSASISAAPHHAAPKQQTLPPPELDMPLVANLDGETLPLTDDLQSLIADAYETADPISIDTEAIPPLEDESPSFVALNPNDVELPSEVAALVDENFERWDEVAPPTYEPTPSPVNPPKSEPQSPPAASTSTSAPAERNELTHMLPLIAGWVVAILVLIYQLLKDTRRDEENEE